MKLWIKRIALLFSTLALLSSGALFFWAKQWVAENEKPFLEDEATLHPELFTKFISSLTESSKVQPFKVVQASSGKDAADTLNPKLTWSGTKSSERSLTLALNIKKKIPGSGPSWLQHLDEINALHLDSAWMKDLMGFE